MIMAQEMEALMAVMVQVVVRSMVVEAVDPSMVMQVEVQQVVLSFTLNRVKSLFTLIITMAQLLHPQQKPTALR